MSTSMNLQKVLNYGKTTTYKGENSDQVHRDHRPVVHILIPDLLLMEEDLMDLMAHMDITAEGIIQDIIITVAETLKTISSVSSF